MLTVLEVLHLVFGDKANEFLKNKEFNDFLNEIINKPNNKKRKDVPINEINGAEFINIKKTIDRMCKAIFTFQMEQRYYVIFNFVCNKDNVTFVKGADQKKDFTNSNLMSGFTHLFAELKNEVTSHNYSRPIPSEIVISHIGDAIIANQEDKDYKRAVDAIFDQLDNTQIVSVKKVRDHVFWSKEVLFAAKEVVERAKDSLGKHKFKSHQKNPKNFNMEILKTRLLEYKKAFKVRLENIRNEATNFDVKVGKIKQEREAFYNLYLLVVGIIDFNSCYTSNTDRSNNIKFDTIRAACEALSAACQNNGMKDAKNESNVAHGDYKEILDNLVNSLKNIRSTHTEYHEGQTVKRKSTSTKANYLKQIIQTVEPDFNRSSVTTAGPVNS